MRILVLSDSHSAMHFMRDCVDAVKPDAIIHLGDYYDDAQALHEDFPRIPLYQVPGNCDRYRTPPGVSEIQVTRILGVNFYLTHGHRHNVKMYTGKLLRDARECAVQAVLYGHTHQAECCQEDGMWVMNPGTCGYGGGTAGLIEVERGKILSCRILDSYDLSKLDETDGNASGQIRKTCL